MLFMTFGNQWLGIFGTEFARFGTLRKTRGILEHCVYPLPPYDGDGFWTPFRLCGGVAWRVDAVLA
ncbi:hypothetical protein BOSEA1005_20066 [Hyphomicrobiales bacterium]|nr:hypothetical protein BOSEA1005_20066 [Hyphomicrobiales bacterium]CAI0344248.1 hypothetical protein BO1005MUT1_320078 [Hyphomicrobiales bacterium]